MSVHHMYAFRFWLTDSNHTHRQNDMDMFSSLVPIYGEMLSPDYFNDRVMRLFLFPILLSWANG